MEMSDAFQMWTCNGRRIVLGRERRTDSNGLSVVLVPVARN